MLVKVVFSLAFLWGEPVTLGGVLPVLLGGVLFLFHDPVLGGVPMLNWTERGQV